MKTSVAPTTLDNYIRLLYSTKARSALVWRVTRPSVTPSTGQP